MVLRWTDGGLMLGGDLGLELGGDLGLGLGDWGENLGLAVGVDGGSGGDFMLV